MEWVVASPTGSSAYKVFAFEGDSSTRAGGISVRRASKRDRALLDSGIRSFETLKATCQHRQPRFRSARHNGSVLDAKAGTLVISRSHPS